MNSIAIRSASSTKIRGARTRLVGSTVRYVVLIAVGLLLAMPYVWMVSTSLKQGGTEFALRPELIPNPVVWGNYAQVFQIAPVHQWFWNSTVIAFLTIVGRLITATMAGFAFARLQFPMRGPMFALCLSTLMLPGIVTLIPEFIVFRYLNWTNSNLPLWVPAWCGGGAFFVFLSRQFFMTLPYEIDEAAKVDGASPFVIYTQVVLPLSVPVLVSIVIFSFNGVWSDFLHPLIYLNDQNKMTLAVGLNSMIGQFATAWNLLMASAFITSIPVIVVFFAGQKYFVRGVVMSGLGGR